MAKHPKGKKVFCCAYGNCRTPTVGATYIFCKKHQEEYDNVSAISRWTNSLRWGKKKKYSHKEIRLIENVENSALVRLQLWYDKTKTPLF